MKKVMILVVLLIASLSVMAQTINANRLIVRDSIYVGGKWIKGVSDDSTLGNGATNIVPTQKAVKDHFQIYGVNVLSFGAKNDSSQNATAAFRHAIQYAYSSGINKVIIPSGTYKFVPDRSDSAAIVLKNNIELIGIGNPVLTWAKNDSDWNNLIEINNITNVKVRGITIDGRKNELENIGQHSHNIDITNGAKNIMISDCHLINSLADGIDIGNPSQRFANKLPTNIIITNCFIDSCSRNGISVTTGKNINIDNVIVSHSSGHNPQSGIDIEPNKYPYGTLQNINISNIIASFNEGAGIIIQTPDVSLVSFKSYKNGGYGIYVTQTLYNDYKNIISDGNIYSNGLDGIKIYNVEDASISNLIISSNASRGLHAVNSSFTLCNSVVDSNSLFAIDIRGVDMGKIVIAGNRIYANTNGIYAGSNNGIISSNIIFQNGGVDATSGNVLQGDDWLFSANKVYAEDGAGLYVNGKNNLIDGNVFFANSRSEDEQFYNLQVYGNAKIINNLIYAGDSSYSPLEDIYISSSANNVFLAENTTPAGNLSTIDNRSLTTIFSNKPVFSAIFDGGSTDYVVNYTASFTPSKIIITPTSQDAAKALLYVDKSTITNSSFTVKAAGTAPAGTDNITFDYELIK